MYKSCRQSMGQFEKATNEKRNGCNKYKEQ